MSELRVDTITDELGTGSPDFPNGITVSNATFGTIDITGSTIESTPIGQVTPAAGDFTTLSANSVNIDGGTIDGTAVNATTLTASGDVNFDSGTLFVDESTNRVGIGTTSPSNKLTISETSGGNILTHMRLTNPSTTNNTGSGIVMGGLHGSVRISGLTPSGSTLVSGDILFETINNFSPFNYIERMRIDSSGNLLFNSGYGSVATAYGCRAWVNFDGTDTVSIRGSGNVSSITDLGVGNYQVNFTTAMPDINYTFAASSEGGGSTQSVVSHRGPFFLTSHIEVLIRDVDNTSLRDRRFVGIAVFR